MDGVQDKARHLAQGLARVQDAAPDIIKSIRGRGLLLGLHLTIPPADFVKAALAEKLLLVGAGDMTVRVIPPLTASIEELSDACDRLARTAQSLSNRD